MANKSINAHNDYLHLLMSLGVVGLAAFLLIHFVLLMDVYMSIVNKSTKYFYYGIIFSITFMNFANGVILYQVGISQLFWMVMGFLYVFRDFGEISSPGLRNGNMTESLQSRSSEIYGRGYGIYKP